MRNSEAVQIKEYEDTGYTNICPDCNKRSGSGPAIPRELTIDSCTDCRRKYRLARLNNEPRPDGVGVVF